MLRRIDPLGPLFAILGLGVFLIHGYGGVLTRDLSLYAYSGQQFADGVAPYVSVMNRAGPLAHVVPGIGALLADWMGTDDVLTQRVVMTILSMITVWLMYVTGRDLFRSRSAGAIAASTLLTIQGFMLYATGGPREKTTMVLMVLICVYAVVHRRWLWAGVAISLATMTWQPSFFVGSATAVAAMVGLGRREFWRALLRFCVGGAVPAVLTMIGFAVWGAFGALIDGFLLINARYTDQGSLIGFLFGDPSAMYDGFGPSLWVLLIGLVAAVVNGYLQWRHSGQRSDPLVRAQIALGLGVVFSLLWSLRAFNGWADAMFVVPVAVLGFTAAVSWVLRKVPSRPAVAAYCAVALVLAGVNASYQSVDALPTQRLVAHDVFRIAGPDATIASVGGPMPLVLEHKTNPVKYQMFLNGFDDYVNDTYPGGLSGLADKLDSYKPTFVTMDYPQFYDWIQPMIDREYVEIGTSADLTWFARTDLGQTKIDQLKKVVAEHPIPERP